MFLVFLFGLHPTVRYYLWALPSLITTSVCQTALSPSSTCISIQFDDWFIVLLFTFFKLRSVRGRGNLPWTIDGLIYTNVSQSIYILNGNITFPLPWISGLFMSHFKHTHSRDAFVVNVLRRPAVLSAQSFYFIHLKDFFILLGNKWNRPMSWRLHQSKGTKT